MSGPTVGDLPQSAWDRVAALLREGRERHVRPDQCDTGDHDCDGRLRRLHLPYQGWRWLCMRCRRNQWALLAPDARAWREGAG